MAAQSLGHLLCSMHPWLPRVFGWAKLVLPILLPMVLSYPLTPWAQVYSMPVSFPMNVGTTTDFKLVINSPGMFKLACCPACDAITSGHRACPCRQGNHAQHAEASIPFTRFADVHTNARKCAGPDAQWTYSPEEDPDARMLVVELLDVDTETDTAGVSVCRPATPYTTCEAECGDGLDNDCEYLEHARKWGFGLSP